MVSMCYAMREALEIVAEEGLDKMWARHLEMHEMLWDGLKKMGLQPFVERDEDRWGAGFEAAGGAGRALGRGRGVSDPLSHPGYRRPARRASTAHRRSANPRHAALHRPLTALQSPTTNPHHVETRPG